MGWDEKTQLKEQKPAEPQQSDTGEIHFAEEGVLTVAHSCRPQCPSWESRAGSGAQLGRRG